MTNDKKARQIALKDTSNFSTRMMAAMDMADWKDEQFWSVENITRIIITYNSFPDRSCPGELVKKTIAKLREPV